MFLYILDDDKFHFWKRVQKLTLEAHFYTVTDKKNNKKKKKSPVLLTSPVTVGIALNRAVGLGMREEKDRNGEAGVGMGRGLEVTSRAHQVSVKWLLLLSAWVVSQAIEKTAMWNI